jgi:hypothetical protein
MVYELTGSEEENAQIPRHVLMPSLRTEKEDHNEGDEFKEASYAELRDPKQKEERFAPFWVCGWRA